MLVSLQSIIFSVLIASNFPAASLYLCRFVCMHAYCLQVFITLKIRVFIYFAIVLSHIHLLTPNFVNGCKRTNQRTTVRARKSWQISDENERRRPCFIVHTRLCIHNMEHRARTHMLCLLIIFHYFSSCCAICVGCCCCCCCCSFFFSLFFIFATLTCNVYSAASGSFCHRAK